MAVNLTQQERDLIESNRPDPNKEVVLSVQDLRISFKTDNGKVQAVRGVSFDLYKQETLCIVGESGSGKSVTSKAIMGILSSNAVVEGGHIIYQGEDLLKISEEEYHRIRGHKIGMIFQDPLSSLNPIVKIGKQIIETTMINNNQLKNRYNDLIAKELVAYKNAKVLRDVAISDANNEYSDKVGAVNGRISALEATVRDDMVELADIKRNKVKPEHDPSRTEETVSAELENAKKELGEVRPTLKTIKAEADKVRKEKIAQAKAEYKAKAPALKEALNARKKTAKAENEEFRRKIEKERDEQLAAIQKKRENLNLPQETLDKIKEYDRKIQQTKLKYDILIHLNIFTTKNRAHLREKADAELIRLADERRKYAEPLDALDREEHEAKFHYQKQVRITKAMAKAHALEIMKEVGIPQPEKRFYQYPFQFSGGMRQRIVIAIALTAAPDILICDEPTTALDVTIQAQILELINRLKAERHLSCIFITHDLGVVANMADRVAVMYAGKICEYGTENEIFFDPRHPYTWALLSSIPDIDSKEKLEAIPGTPPDMIYPPEGDAFAARNRYALGIDLKYQPPYFKITDTHYAATWLEYDKAPKVEPPKIVVTRIKNALRDEEAKIAHEQKGSH